MEPARFRIVRVRILPVKRQSSPRTLPAPVPSAPARAADLGCYVTDAPYIRIFPGPAISLIVPGFNLIVDGLRDALDPTFGR